MPSIVAQPPRNSISSPPLCPTNCYSKCFIQLIVKTKRKSTKTFKEYRATTYLPFIDGICQQLHHRLDSHGIRTVFSSNATIPNYLVHPNGPPIPDRRDGIVYGIPCKICNEVYIGETGIPVGERIQEQHRDVRLMQIDHLAIAEHTYDADHLPQWSGVQCFVHDRHWYTRQVKEAIQIRLHPNTQNRDRGIDIPES